MITYSPEKIIALRILRGMNQSELARRSRLSSPTVWALERGRTMQPKNDTLMSISIALGVPLGDIMADAQDSNIDEQLRAAHGALNPANKAAMLAAARSLLDSQKTPRR